MVFCPRGESNENSTRGTSWFNGSSFCRGAIRYREERFVRRITAGPHTKLIQTIMAPTPHEISLPIAPISGRHAVMIVVSRKNVGKLHGLALHRIEDRGGLSRAPEDLA